MPETEEIAKDAARVQYLKSELISARQHSERAADDFETASVQASELGLNTSEGSNIMLKASRQCRRSPERYRNPGSIFLTRATREETDLVIFPRPPGCSIQSISGISTSDGRISLQFKFRGTRTTQDP